MQCPFRVNKLFVSKNNYKTTQENATQIKEEYAECYGKLCQAWFPYNGGGCKRLTEYNEYSRFLKK
jgi:hypothetical protein